MPGLFDSYGAYLKQRLADNSASGFMPAQTPTPDLSPVQGLTVSKPKGLFARFTSTDPDTGANGWDRLMLAGAALKAADPDDGGATLRNVMSAQRAQVQAAQARARQQQLNATADQLSLDPRERLVFMANPEEWAKQNATRYGFHDVTGGNTVVNGPGGAMQVAPKLVEDGGIYGTQTDAGYQQTGARGPSIAERETAANNRFDNLTKGLPTGFHPEFGPDGQPTGKWMLDPNFAQFETNKAAAGATRVNVPVTLPAQNEFAKAFAGQYATDLSGARQDADAAQRSLQTLQDVSGLVDKANTGAFASLEQQRDRILAGLGNSDAAGRASDTQLLESQLNSMVLPLVKQLGSSNSITDADREFIKKIVGSKDLTPEAIKRIVKIQERDAKAKVERFQSMGQEAFSTVPSAQGLPAAAFGGGGPARRRFNPATGRIE